MDERKDEPKTGQDHMNQQKDTYIRITKINGRLVYAQTAIDEQMERWIDRRADGWTQTKGRIERHADGQTLIQSFPLTFKCTSGILHWWMLAVWAAGAI